MGIVAGPLVDRLGVRRALLLGSIVSVIGRFLVAVTFSKAVMLFSLLVLIPFGTALGIPVLTIGVKRHSGRDNRTIAFSVYYGAWWGSVSACVLDHLTVPRVGGGLCSGAACSPHPTPPPLVPVLPTQWS